MTVAIVSGPAWIPKFLAALRETGKVRHAIELAEISANSAYFQRTRNREFAEAWESALVPIELQVDQVSPPLVLPHAGWRACFLDALAETSNVSASAARANVPLRTVYKTRRQDSGFAAKWRTALHEGYDNLEMEVLGYLRDPRGKPKMDVAAALRLLVAHRETIARERALHDDDDEQAVLNSIDAFIEEMRQRRAANAAILIETDTMPDAMPDIMRGEGTDDGTD